MKIKRRKGFTLIELLAVIVVLAIISTIGYVFVGDAINDAKNEIEVQNAKTLEKTVSNYIAMQEMNGNYITEEQFYVIKNDVEYKISPNGDLTQTNNFEYNGKLCDYCVVKINTNKQIGILLEGNMQDVKKDYDSTDFIVKPLSLSREDTSFYNELVLFKDIYISNNIIETVKKFIIQLNIVSEVLENNTTKKEFTLQNSSGNGTLKIIDKDNFIITLTKDDTIIEFDSNGNFTTKDNINSEYPDNILALYDELKKIANNYIATNTISDEVYFEFSNGTINKKDVYGNNIADSTVVMDKNILGSGELRINSSKQISVVIYEDNYDIKNDYGSDKLYNQDITLPRNIILLFRNLHRLELLAESYTGGQTSSDFAPSKSDWLVFHYLRQLRYTGSMWDTVAGSDSEFITLVNSKGTYLKSYFSGITEFTVNNDTIDFLHMTAVLATRMYQTAGGIYKYLDQGIVDSVSSWAGDFQTFMTDNLLPIVEDKTSTGYYDATLKLLGNSNTSFSMEDMYSDVDGWVIYENLIDNLNLDLYTAFYEYYSGSSQYSFKNRFTRFISDEVFMKYYSPEKYNRYNSSSPTLYTPTSFRNTISIYTYNKLMYAATEIVWPLFEGYEIPTALSSGTRKGLQEWLENKAALENK